MAVAEAGIERVGISHIRRQDVGPDAQHDPHHTPDVVIIRRLFVADGNAQPFQAVDHFERKQQERAEQVFLADRHAQFGLGPRFMRVMQQQPAYRRVHQAYLLHGGDQLAAVRESTRIHQVQAELGRLGHAALRVVHLVRRVQHFDRTLGGIALDQPSGGQHQADVQPVMGEEAARRLHPHRVYPGGGRSRRPQVGLHTRRQIRRDRRVIVKQMAQHGIHRRRRAAGVDLRNDRIGQRIAFLAQGI